MYQKIIANTPKFLMFDLQPLTENKNFIFGADYILIRPKQNGCILHLSSTQTPLVVGQLVLLAPFNPFKINIDNNKICVGDVLHFRLNALGQTFIDSVQFSKIKNMLDHAKQGLLFESEWLDPLFEIMDNIENTFDFKQLLNILMLLDQLTKTQPSQILETHQLAFSTTKRTENRIDSVLQYLATNLAEPLTVTIVAQQLHMAESTFSRFFHTHLGVTFRQYLIEQRVKQAARYLVSTDWSIAHIGAEVGFSSLSNFNEKFKTLLHVTPRHYRANHVALRENIGHSQSIQGQVQKQFHQWQTEAVL
ncbi:helix-turn-helix domain-containing protein [Photobacterium phosphoreum]|uniref:helix-turn-helix domain-containing protein n=1 Tax=Photobacterium phosphoreum TaxID=659 RepID=UPI0005D4370D|nr:AraC family transcriptional regulator [Photobacterium phosphoreum]KJF87346.1 transcriptional regulator [Photobacterium phosphoreum]MCD9462172.1 AraC family transcriptional regulator [Photobacterium phosphoreum]MCD9477754.1 helix-turn-helix domain-containing protein [Photobacterium phosphoreum]MCD9481925.1 helix-turn-helix domain-containing protein [Photobacterium phosphoreum]OBU33253.1 transcriptional regulator [Photobacterium phosphoreum]